MSLEQGDLARLRGLGERLDLTEVEEVYLPLSRLLHFYVEATHGLRLATSEFLGERPTRVPFVVGVAGSVAVGKSTTSRILKELMSRWPHTPRVELVTTDGFLHSNAELERRGLLQRKGFPESYDRRALMRFIAAVKSGVPVVEAPQYSHLTYDVLPGTTRVRRPGRAHRRGAQRAAAPDGAARRLEHRGDLGLLRLLGLRRRPGRGDPRLVRRALPPPARDGLRRPPVVLPPVRRAERRRGAGDGDRRSGSGSTSRTSSRTCCPPGTGRRSCSPRARTTR